MNIIGSSKVIIDPSQASGFSRVLQGKEISILRGNFIENNESDSSKKPTVWPPLLDDEKVDIHSASRRCLSDKWLPLGRSESSSTDLLSGFGGQASSSHGFHLPTGGQTTPANMVKRQALDKENDFSLLEKQWSLVSSGLSLNLMDSELTGADTLYQMRGTSSNGFNEYPTIPGHRIDNQQGNWLMSQSILPYIQMSTHSGEITPKSMASLQPEAVKPKEGSCKLFDIPLVSKCASIDPVMLQKNSSIDSASNMHFGKHPHQFPITESDQRFEQSRGSKLLDNGIIVSDQEVQFQTSHPGAQDREGKGLVNSTRSCTKVHKQGTALERSVDLAKFNNYEELIAELDHLFDFNGELKAPKKNWMVVYTDDEGDMMLVGDDPWQEFCGMVRKIFIYKKEEVQRKNPGTLNSKGKDNSSIAEGSDAKEVKNLQLPSDSSPEDS